MSGRILASLEAKNITIFLMTLSANQQSLSLLVNEGEQEVKLQVKLNSILNSLIWHIAHMSTNI